MTWLDTRVLLFVPSPVADAILSIDETRFVATTDLLFALCVRPVQEQHIVALGIV